MSIATTIEQYLTDQGVEYDVLAHRPTQSSSETAQASHVSGDRIAKGVVLNTGDGYLLAVLPASHHVRLGQLKAYLNRPVGLATERETASLFADCEFGAVPAVGRPYGLEVILDDSLADQPDVYFEAGDHATLVHLTAEGFRKALGDVTHADFSTQE
jgi:Ala-tRNA(Pro) deacylase